MATIAAWNGAGCSPATHYYTLSQVNGSALLDTAPPNHSAVIAVGPVSLPDYVDRPQIVVRTSANTIEQAPFDQWGGSLDDMVPQLLVDDLARLLPADHFVTFPQVSEIAFDYRVPVTISQFDVSKSGEAVVAAHWQIRGRQGAADIVVRETVVRAQATGASYAERVAALSRAVGDLTGEIATALAALPRGESGASAVPSKQKPKSPK